MDDFTNLAELAQGSQSSPVIVIIEQHVLARTCILNILKRELSRIRDRRDGYDEWPELVIRQRYPLDRAEYRGQADH